MFKTQEWMSWFQLVEPRQCIFSAVFRIMLDPCPGTTLISTTSHKSDPASLTQVPSIQRGSLMLAKPYNTCSCFNEM